LNARLLSFQAEPAVSLLRSADPVVSHELHQPLLFLKYIIFQTSVLEKMILTYTLAFVNNACVSNFPRDKDIPPVNTFLTTKQAAEMLGISDSRIRQLILDGQVPAVKAGRDWLIRASDLRRAEKRKTKPGPPAKSGQQRRR
jgi:excisionase family DNA binding protein